MKMQIQTFSIVVGGTACNAKCPFCVAGMTGDMGVTNPKGSGNIHFRNLHKAIMFAKNSGVSTAMLTGKGEPTLWPQDIHTYLGELKDKFPFIELQTNAIWNNYKDDSLSFNLSQWLYSGLNTIAISVTHFNQQRNAKIYGGKHFDLSKRIKMLHDIGYSVRLSCVLVKDFICDPFSALQMIDFCKANDVEQLTFVPVNKPEKPSNALPIYDWVSANHLPKEAVEGILNELDNNGTRLLELPHGAVVFDYEGQNVCMSNCLNQEVDKTHMRNLIFFPDGHLRYRWDKKGSVIL